ncbi:tyrosine-protein phosphatase non-receptor type substrate 1-like isoform X2 [Ascaphus truei]|uniref:tyrosine-protein phosphatase non-receptor type substrate 1-like isoform X2 n=1 Tax=Ascaphus truei TaxID=8439 RepID=UPI003F5ABED8
MSAALLVLLLPVAHVYAQLQVNTSPSAVIAQLGTTATLRCNFTSGVAPVDPAQVHVLWKNEGKKVLSYAGEVTVFRPGAQLSVERVALGDVSLSLPNVSEADGGRYSCSVRLASELGVQSITMIVRDHRQISVEGTVVIVNQSNELRCRAGNLSTSEVMFEWLRNGQVLSTSTPRVLEDLNSEGVTVESSFCITPTMKDHGAQFSCQVLQKTSPYPLKKTFQLTFGVRPDVIFLLSSKGQKNSSLVCMAIGFYPDDLSLTLKRDGQLLGESMRKWMNPNGTFSLMAACPFNATLKDDNVDFTCTVYHSTLPGGSTERLRFTVDPYVPRAFWVIVAVGLVVAVGIPFLCKHVTDIAVCKDWTEGSTAVLKCSITGRYPKSITSVWLVRRGEKELLIKERGSLHPIGDYRELQEQDGYTCWNTLKSRSVCGLRHSLSSVLCFQVHKEHHDRAEFICRFMRGDKILEEKRFFGTVLDNYGFYSVSGVSVPDECNEGEKLTLSCSMLGNVPREIRVTWERCVTEERTPISKEQDVNYQVTENKSGGQLCSFLTFCPSLDDSGAVFTCSFCENEGRILAERSSQPLKVAEPKKNTWSRTYQDWGFRAFDESGITEI